MKRTIRKILQVTLNVKLKFCLRNKWKKSSKNNVYYDDSKTAHEGTQMHK